MIYPYYLHNNEEFVNYWKNYFKNNPINDDTRIEIYVDFPFCRSICKFCVFGSYTLHQYVDQINLYEEAVVNLVKDMKDAFPERVNNIYFGGGTPTLWNKKKLIELTKNIPIYDEIKLKTFEVHPFDISDEMIDFIINDLNIKTVSFGVQSFDEISNKEQQRIPGNIEMMKKGIEKFHEHNMFVNIDIVALFNDDNEHGWEVFINDLDIASSVLKPDGICSSVNFKCKNYYGKSIYYRKILKNFLDHHPEYVIAKPESLSLNIDDIIAFEEEPYYIRTPEYHQFHTSCNVGIIDRNFEIAKNNIIIAFGGNGIHNAISRAGANMEEISSRYDFEKQRFIHQVNKIKVPDETKKVQKIRIGTQLIDQEYDLTYSGK